MKKVSRRCDVTYTRRSLKLSFLSFRAMATSPIFDAVRKRRKLDYAPKRLVLKQATKIPLMLLYSEGYAWQNDNVDTVLVYLRRTNLPPCTGTVLYRV